MYSGSFSTFSFTPYETPKPSLLLTRTSPPVLKGRPLDISESKKLNEFSSFSNHIVELVCTQNGSKSLQVA